MWDYILEIGKLKWTEDWIQPGSQIHLVPCAVVLGKSNHPEQLWLCSHCKKGEPDMLQVEGDSLCTIFMPSARSVHTGASLLLPPRSAFSDPPSTRISPCLIMSPVGILGLHFPSVNLEIWKPVAVDLRVEQRTLTVWGLVLIEVSLGSHLESAFEHPKGEISCCRVLGMDRNI